MNLEKLLKGSRFTLEDKVKMISYISSLRSSVTYSLTNSETNNMLIINDPFIDHYFIKSDNVSDIRLITFDQKSKIYIDYSYYNEFVPMATYKMVKGQSTGLGNGTKEEKRKFLSYILYISDNLKMYLLVHPKNKNTFSICIQRIDTIKKGSTIDLTESIYYFSFDLIKNTLINESFQLQKEYKIPFQASLKAKYKQSSDLGEAFISCISPKEAFKNPYKHSSSYQEFIDLFNMMEI